VPRSQHLHAVGKYQIIGSTLKGLVDRGLASPSERFTPAVQDRLFIALARGRIVRGNVEATMRGLQQEWIGLQYADKAKLRQATIDLMRNAGRL
jgi:muramidase (phage lysozyme)